MVPNSRTNAVIIQLAWFRNDISQERMSQARVTSPYRTYSWCKPSQTGIKFYCPAFSHQPSYKLGWLRPLYAVAVQATEQA